MEKKPEDSLDYWKEIQNWSGLLSKRIKQFDDIVKAMQSVNLAVTDKEVLKELISALAKLNQVQTKPQKEKVVSKQSAESSGSDEFLVQLMNTPAISNVFKEVFKNKRKW